MIKSVAIPTSLYWASDKYYFGIQLFLTKPCNLIFSGIRNKLLESEDHVCPSCDSMDVSPDGLIANQMLRRAVTSFQNETGYSKIAKITAARMQQAQQAQQARAEAQAAAAQAAKLAPVVPRGPSVLDYKPPPRAVEPASSAAPASYAPAQTSEFSTPKADRRPSIPEPPTPTMDEPIRNLGHQQSSPELPPPHSSYHSYDNTGDRVNTYII